MGIGKLDGAERKSTTVYVEKQCFVAIMTSARSMSYLFPHRTVFSEILGMNDSPFGGPAFSNPLLSALGQITSNEAWRQHMYFFAPEVVQPPRKPIDEHCNEQQSA